MSNKEADAVADIIKSVDELPIDFIDKATVLKTAAAFFEGMAQAQAMREVLQKAVLQATMPKDISIN